MACARRARRAARAFFAGVAWLASAVPVLAQTAPPEDMLGRDTPRGTFLGFIDAARKTNFELAALYLNTPLHGRAAADLALQLYGVLDSRLPARLPEISDRPEGSRSNPLKPDRDVVATIVTADGPLDIIVERVTRGSAGRVWLFSSRTLDAIPAVYDDVRVVSVDRLLPGWLTPRVAGIRLVDWILFLVVLPALYRGLGLLRLPVVGVPGAARLLLLAVGMRIVVRSVDLPLVERRFWTTATAMMFVTAVVWIGMMLARWGEGHLLRRRDRTSVADTTSLLRLGRRVVDAGCIVAGLLVVLRYFGIDPTAALAGLGIGGIAVALSAQKTLENVIGGLSIIFDQAVRVGDFVKVGTTAGTVEYVGLRSARIRTLDRTVLTIPNGQFAALNIERLSDRDKFWFHHIVGVIYGTTAAQLQAIAGEIRDHLRRHTRADDSAIRVRVVRFAASSIDLEISVYLFARDWDDFLELQEALLLDVMGVIEHHGSSIAFPTQTVHLAALPAAAGESMGDAVRA